ncbi:Major facilitator superfamily MFS_1 [Tepidanaerobacter acetatoxydans Re1]|uniref:Major facilitator superfamily MFS_1 n=1 Tax=Tepidanaerobacter acetatoxydans (strain DSM 21804 / JCM 16047 / Re1) TaxID=1209989 RepID=F4LTG2_TEPAE|nr:MFS transporter [Tepidanaerobacter acetatoxydans]AEE90493.1 major facilitator superfamily MFS_1 [Tepidanaerobacter acetatoxydans Re1]CDI40347.1 Major facilitator superfamily MFS_1 [Tepidanaerobacter acetatoxydans Re1]
MSKKKVTFAIMSVFFIAMGVGTITPAIQNIAEAFPHINFSTILLVSTLPSLFIIPSTALAGVVAGNQVRYRTLLIVGILLFTVAGAAPAFMNDFATILIARAFFGIGLGVIMPLGNAMILNLFDGQERANMLGLSGLVMNLGGIVLQLLGGILCSIKWNYAFLAHLLGVISLVMVIFMLPEPEKQKEEDKGKISIPFSVYLASILFGIAMMLNYPLLVNMSTIIITDNLGDAASAGIVLSMFTVGGMLAGAIFGKLYQKATRFTIPIGLAIMAIGAGFVYYANNLMLLTFGMTLVGIGFGIVMPAVMMIIGMIVSPASFAAASGILMAFMNLGGFVSTYYIAFLSNINSAIRFPIFVAMVAYGISAVVYALTQLKTPPSITQKV